LQFVLNLEFWSFEIILDFELSTLGLMAASGRALLGSAFVFALKNGGGGKKAGFWAL
jgi:hypothetical protein